MAAATTQEQRRDEYQRMDDYDAAASNSMNEWSAQAQDCQRKWMDFLEAWTRLAIYPMRAFQQLAQHRN